MTIGLSVPDDDLSVPRQLPTTGSAGRAGAAARAGRPGARVVERGRSQMRPASRMRLQYGRYTLLSAMTAGEKARSLRTVEGERRCLGREMSQLAVARATKRGLRAAFSQSYLSQIGDR